MSRLSMTRFFSLLMLLLGSQQVMAQQTVEMADQLRADGKIWVVVGVIAIVFFGIVAYLIRLDSKIGSLEREVRDRQPAPRSAIPADRTNA